MAIKSRRIAEKQISEKQTRLHYFIVFLLLCGKQNITYNKIKSTFARTLEIYTSEIWGMLEEWILLMIVVHWA